jgi:hypothetical protein
VAVYRVAASFVIGQNGHAIGQRFEYESVVIRDSFFSQVPEDSNGRKYFF